MPRFFRIAVVEGNTPFSHFQFISERDSSCDRYRYGNHVEQSSEQGHHSCGTQSHKNLFFMDLNQLWLSEETAQVIVPSMIRSTVDVLHEVPKLIAEQLTDQGVSQDVSRN